MAVERLITGFRNFRETYYNGKPEFYRALVEKGQKPDVMVVACSDSRVNPSIIAQAEPGELFIVRNVANLVPPYKPDNSYHGTSAAIEYAVRVLGVGHIIILGHSHCGGIHSLCEGEKESKGREFIDDWMSIVGVAVNSKLNGAALHRYVEKEAVKISMNNLLSFPWVKSRVDVKELEIHGWLFDLEAGDLISYSEKKGWQTLIK
jgi:carbonic anhydrase